MPPFDDLIGWFFKLAAAGIMSFFWWGKKEDKKMLDSHAQAIVELKSTAVTEDKVRQIITEVTSSALHPMLQMVEEIKVLVTDNTNTTKSLEIKMAAHEGYQAAIKELAAQASIPR